MRFLITAFGALCLAGCASDELARPDVNTRADTAAQIAAAAGFVASTVEGNPFAIQTFYRGSGDAVRIYIEGDGFAWESRHRQSGNPTPINPVALRLATRDPAQAVAYLARPCQFATSPACHRRYWGEARFAEDVIAAMDDAVNVVKARAGATSVNLVGFSGGAAVAALLAARRDDVVSLLTVAGYLDHVALNEALGVSPLSESLDPMRSAYDLRTIPQLHLSGADDPLIPIWVAQGFVAAQGPASCATAATQLNAGHHQGWEAAWPDLLAKPLPCSFRDN